MEHITFFITKSIHFMARERVDFHAISYTGIHLQRSRYKIYKNHNHCEQRMLAYPLIFLICYTADWPLRPFTTEVMNTGSVQQGVLTYWV